MSLREAISWIPLYIRKIAARSRQGGAAGVVAWLYRRALQRFYEKTYGFKARLHFGFQGKRYHYFCQEYNSAWDNERTVEIPIILGHLEKYRGSRILEVGNVLSHYYPQQHDIVDKYEAGSGVRNEDIVDFKAPTPYDLIVSISTIEHIGFDEKPRDPEKVVRALSHLRSMIAPGGTFIFTFALGYNPNLDKLFIDNQLPLDHRYYLRRYSWFNFWKEVQLSAHDTPAYGSPYHAGNWVAVGIASRDPAAT